MVALLHVSHSKYNLQDGGVSILIEHHASLAPQVLRMLGNGHGAVIFFFVLSGFVLSLALKRRPNDTSGFVVNRLFRIYPAVISTILAFVLVYLTTGGALSPPQSAMHVLANMALFKTDMNGVMWSLQLELIAAPFILASFHAWRRWGYGALAVLFVALVVLSFVGFWTGLLDGNPPLSALHAFIAGMLAALHGETWVKKVGWSRLLLGVFIAGFFVTRPVVGWASNWSVIFEVLFACGIVSQLAYGPFPRRPIPVLSYYGKISYSFYLLHPLSLIAIWSSPALLGTWVRHGVSPVVIALTLFVASVAAITVLAHLQQTYVERMGTRLGRALNLRIRDIVARRESASGALS